MNKNKRHNESIEGVPVLDGCPATGAVVVKTRYDLLVRFLNEVRQRSDLEVVYVRISPGRLYIVGEDGK